MRTFFSSIGMIPGKRRLNTVRLLALAILTAAFGATASAQCGVSLADIERATALAKSQPQLSRNSLIKESLKSEDDSNGQSIVGLWHIHFLVGGTEFQEAFQIWNEGGTEVHNPKVDPRTSSVCLGAWGLEQGRTFKLNHRVWLYDPNGNFQGLGILTETVILRNFGTSQIGVFNISIIDPNGNPAGSVGGTVVGDRITAN